MIQGSHSGGAAASGGEWLTSGYFDTGGVWHPTTDETRHALLRSMQADAEPRAELPAVLVARAGEPFALPRPGTVRLEQGGDVRVEAALPPDLPPGYHDYVPRDAMAGSRLIVSPGRCYLPPDLRVWGWSVQLHALRSERSWGIGDLSDLRRLAHWARQEQGAGLIALNPLHAPTPVLPIEPSPYYPSSRIFRNPLYLCVEEAPGAAESDLDLHALGSAARALLSERRIDRDAVFRAKIAALELLWSRFRGDERFDRFREERGVSLERFAVFCALAERHGRDWRSWPEEYRRPGSPAVARFALNQQDRVNFHAWLQWLLDEQLRRVEREVPILHDLAIGVDPGGADAWAWQEVVAQNATVGAPPDAYNRRGQNWGLSPFIPWALRRAHYEPFIQALRAAVRGGGGVRIDHVMGLFRLFWIPEGWEPVRGAYVRYPSAELLAILALESQRARAIVVGEDLGTVEAGVRERLAEAGLLSSRVFWFEERPPREYPRQSLATMTTHDLPTIVGLWTGEDVERQREIGLEPNEAGARQARARLMAQAQLTEQSPLDQVVLRAHQVLATASSMVVLATLEDALLVQERPNMPGTTHQWPNWSLALPAPLETIEVDPLVHAVAAALDRRPSPESGRSG